MLSELLTQDDIQISREKLTWEEAIRLSAQPLLTKGKITDSYIEAMINKVKEFGPFIHIGDEIALPHARPEEGVRELGLALLLLKRPVYLLDDPSREIRLFICLAANDNTAHLQALSNLTKILSDKKKLATIMTADTAKDIENIVREN
ncbi:PTS sugar transporter subunit IIA [Streptococcus pantholopis]|uniref:Ascorbate-specific PTS system EIIA component n=1 Tax=Streptococcus pantholopis TaxID=1811193 RepID=A0A172QAA9_9STRE|nr:PTS sugar transporter subunit IIA [Streptococcus pantholopis]AND80381.1 transcriptional regulator [Streptococcus pantholopis]